MMNTTHRPTTPAVALDKTAAESICSKLSCANSAAKALSSLTNSGLSASMVTSCGVMPVPPVTMRAAGAGSVSSWHVCRRIASTSSDTTWCDTTSWPCRPANSAIHRPLSSVSRVRVVDTLMIPIRTDFGALLRCEWCPMGMSRPFINERSAFWDHIFKTTLSSPSHSVSNTLIISFGFVATQ